MKFRIFGVDFVLGFPAAAAVTLVILLDRGHTVEACLAAAFIHECGHLLAMLYCKTPPSKVKFELFTVDISDPNRGRRRLSQELLIICGGVSANLLVFACSASALCFVSSDFLLRIAASNLTVGLFNALPVATLDGGQAVFLLIMRRLSYKAAETAVNILTVILLVPFTVLGILLLFESKNNFSLLVISVYLILSLVLKKEHF